MSDSDFPEQLQRTIQLLEAEVSLLRERNLKLETTLERQSQRHQDVERRLNLHSVSGLPTHYRMDQEIPALLEQWQNTSDFKVAFLLIQLDSKFEMIKRTLKSSVGEWVLYSISERLREVAGDGWLYHTRDNEFLLVRPFTTAAELNQLVRSAGSKIAEPHLFSGFNLMLGSHTGVSQFPQDGFEKSVLLHYADVALGFAQEQKQSVAVYQSDLEQQVIEKMELQNAIIKAIEAPAMREIGHQFDLFFQPKLTLKQCSESEVHVESMGVEMLMRWNHPSRGPISPGRFIPVAEETGLIMPIGKWSLYEVVRRLGRWKKTVLKDIEVSVNISPRQFRSSELVELLEKHVVSEPGLAEKLILEVTETSLFEDPFVAMESLAEFKRLGLKVSVDDFGTGYSSLSHLHKFTLDEIKIDQSFVRGFPENLQDVAIIRSLASIAKELNLHLVAEGVERVEQVVELFGLGCRTIQGYLAAKPMSEKELVKFVEKLHANDGVLKL
jgi:EAL domain-containing protein (putative c-di-GMP-specific phosphodiesterase class I)/GGDEF domain-containing protein